MTRVKICGLTSLGDALAAAEAGADLLGFVLVQDSPRHVEPRRAAEIVAALRQRDVALPCVGVVANLPPGQARALRQQCGFDLIQLHGAEDPAAAAELHPAVIVARRVTGAGSLVGLANYPAYAYLLDARGVERRDAAPATWDWRLLRKAAVRGRVIVAGGLAPENVSQAVRLARPWGVDVASGVEAHPGHKDRAAVARFIRAVREVDVEGECDTGDD